MKRVVIVFLLPCLLWACSPARRMDVVELSVSTAQSAMTDGACSSRSLTQAYLDRIASLDDAGPTLNAVIEVNPRALEDAAALDRERAAGHVRGPLHGIPVLLKDNIDAVGLVNSAGSFALADHRPAIDAFLVARLRDAGAVILGKTNLSEWANFRSTRSTSGWSSRGGQTKNPYALDRSPCGSSAGTAAAIAASLATVGVGTETDGSIICPASMNGLVGLKPTVGLVSRTGIIPISISQDTAGPMGRTVTDVAIMLNVIAAADPADPADPAGAASKDRRSIDYTASLRATALAGKRFGVLRQAMGYHPGVDDLMTQAIDAMRAQGAEVIGIQVPTYNAWNDHEMTVLLYEFKDGLNRYLQRAGARVASLEALIAWNREHADEVMPHFGQELLELAQSTGPLTDAAYFQARDEAKRLAGQDGLLAALETNRLDAVIAPSTSPAWKTDPILGDHFVGAGYAMAAVAGTPSVTVPMGDVSGLPVGLTWMARAYTEADLIGFAYAFEQATAKRRAPRYLAP
jgi:amidase